MASGLRHALSSFAATLQRGLLGEGRIATWLRSRGWNVLPAYEVEMGNGKGPRLYTAKSGELVTPDMLVFQDQRIMWVEAKTKSAFTWYRIGNCWQDGIDLRHWEDYCRVADLSKWDVWILFLHDSTATAKDTPPGKIPPTGLYGQSIQKLRGCIDHIGEKTPVLVYWSIGSLVKLKGPSSVK